MSRARSEQVDGDPLAVIEAHILAAARQRRQRRRHRRRVLVTVGSPAALLIVASAALATTGVGIGVPAIDRYLDALPGPSGLEHDTPSGLPAGASVAPGTDVRPQSGEPSSKVDVQLSDGRTLFAGGYTNRDGDICGALTDPGKAPSLTNGLFGCVDAEAAEQRLRDSSGPFAFAAAGLSSDVIVVGVARQDSDAIRAITATGGALNAFVSEPWQPLVGSAPIRAFFVAIPADTFRPGPGRPFGLVHLEAMSADDSTAEIAE